MEYLIMRNCTVSKVRFPEGAIATPLKNGDWTVKMDGKKVGTIPKDRMEKYQREGVALQIH